MPSPMLKVNYPILMKMLCIRVYSNFIEIKIRYIGDTPNPQYDGVPYVTIMYCYGLFFQGSLGIILLLCIVIVERQ